jgi:ABC-type uncharacterized transport system auxiliary subunit
MKLTASLARYGILALSLLCVSCITFERSYPEKRYFVIEARDTKSGNPGDGPTLAVTNLYISPRYADRAFVYRTSETEYEADFYNQFLSSPAVMITEETRKALAASSRFKYVVGPSSSLAITHVLEGSINSLYGDFRVPTAPAAVLEIELFLHNESAGNPGIVLQKRYMKSVPLKEKSPEALARGWSEALEAVVGMFIADIGERKL